MKLKLNDWVVGPESHHLSHLFLKSADVVILVYSIASKRSFDDLDEWNQDCEEFCPDVIKILVGNKSDREEERAMP